MTYVYIVRCEDGSFYTGYTTNIENRIKQHKTGRGSAWCKTHGFVEYTYIECADSSEGRKLELKVKKWSRNRKEKLFKTNNTFK